MHKPRSYIYGWKPAAIGHAARLSLGARDTAHAEQRFLRPKIFHGGRFSGRHVLCGVPVAGFVGRPDY